LPRQPPDTPAQDIFNLRFDSAAKKVYMFPRDVIDETIKAHRASHSARVPIQLVILVSRRDEPPGLPSGGPFF